MRLGGSRLQAEIGVREIVVNRVVLGREVVGLRFALLAHQLGLGFILVQVMRNGPQVIEELAVDRPAVEFVPQLLANQPRAFRRDGIFQGELVSVRNDIAQALIGGSVFVHRLRGGSKPAFVDAAPVGAQGVVVGRGQPQAPPRHEK